MTRARPILVCAALMAGACTTNEDTEPAADTEAETSAEASSGETGSDDTTPGGIPTFYDDVAPILAQHCRGCHGAGGVAVFPLDTYEETAAVAPIVAAAVKSGSMPPFHVGDDGSCNTYRDARRLAPDEIDTITAWVDGDTPAGELREVPEAAPLPHLDNVDVTLQPDVGYAPPGIATDDYRCFVVDPGLTADRFLTGFEVTPGEPSVVHHVVVFSVDSQAEQDAALALDAASPGAGYPCYGGSETGGGRSLLVWTPGTGATDYPEDTGLRLYAGRPLIMQVHYFGSGPEDRTAVDLALADTVEREAFITGTYDLDLEIPPGEANFVETAALPLPAWSLPMNVHAVYPHMHEYGTTMRVDYDRGEESRCLVDVPDYAFGWQQFFFYDKPVVLDPPGGGHFRITCGFDSTSASEPIVFGEGTGDEMCIAALYVTYG